MGVVNTVSVHYAAPDRGQGQNSADDLEQAAEGIEITTIESDDSLLPSDAQATCFVVEHDPPATDGIAMLRRVREARPELPVIVLAANRERQTVTDALNAGAARCLPRPVTEADRKVVAEQIHSVADQHANSRKRNEAVLSTLGAVDVGVLLSRPQTGAYAVNDHFCRQFDITDRSVVTEESLKAVADKIDSSFDHPGPIGSRMSTLAEQSTPTHRERLELPDGRVFELSYLPMNDSGEATMWLYEDVTGEFERRRQLKQYKTAVNAFEDPMYVLDEDGRFEFVNEALAKLTGRDCTALEGQHVSTIMREEDVRHRKSVTRSLLESDTEDKHTFEMRVIAADGSTVLCENNIGLIRAGDVLQGTVGALRDISERKRREEEIKRERDRLAATFDAAPSPFVQARTDDRGLVIERVNSTFIEVFGYNKTDLIGATLGDRIVPEGVASDDVTSDPHTQEVVRETADGEQRTFLVGSAVAADTEDGTEVIRTYTDITDHKRHVNRLEQIRQNVSDVIWISDPGKDEMEFVSDSYELVWGRSPESLKQNPESFIEAIHSDDRDRVTSALKKQAEHPDEYEETYRIVGPDGDIKWVRDRSSGIYQDGELERVIGVASDITDRKQRQQELERERSFIKQSLDTLEDIFFVIGTDGTFSRWNERLPEVTGYADEMVGTLSAADVIAESDLERLKPAFDEVRDTGRAKLEATLVTSDGERIPYEFRASRLTHPDGTDNGVVGIGRDISEQKRRERELQTFERAVEDAGHAIFWISDDDIIEYVNSAFAQQTGYARDEAVGSMLKELWPEQSVASHDEMWDTVQSGDTWESEFVSRRKDGRRYTVQLSVSAVYEGEDSKQTRYVGVASNITERYRREQRLSVLQRVLRHDLRNNLNEVLLAAQLIDRQSNESEVKSQVEAIYQVVEETLALSRKVRKSQKLFEEGEEYNTVIDVADRTRSQVASLRTERSGVEFAVDLPAAQHVVTSDLVDQALRNVIQNGIEHNDAEAPRIEVTLERRTDKDEVALCVADNGPGVPHEEIDVLRAEQEDQLQHLSGFGLWFVNWVVTNSGGDLEFAENEPRGTVVRLVFPSAEPDAPAN